jgi:hypothetical protein
VERENDLYGYPKSDCKRDSQGSVSLVLVHGKNSSCMWIRESFIWVVILSSVKENFVSKFRFVLWCGRWVGLGIRIVGRSLLRIFQG